VCVCVCDVWKKDVGIVKSICVCLCVCVRRMGKSWWICEEEICV